jgi:tryptophan synthase alpha chain
MATINKVRNRMDRVFSEKKNNILNIYFTAGYPSLEDTGKILIELQNAGVDIVEIGMPYSDPVADGPTIQESNQRALENGMTIKKLFEQLAEIKSQITVPVVLMGYLNPIIQFGIEKFCAKAQEVGISGLILPDLPIQVFQDQYQELFSQFELHNIFLISPQTSEKRIRQIDEQSSGFIYMVSSAAITGAKSEISEAQLAYFQRINEMKLSNPCLIGFGISSRQTFEQASQHSSGAIIGSAFIKVLSQSANFSQSIPQFINSIR